ncbi:MAG TPA: SulP family inorganic anion transporter, partial [Trueperaceae bacterium]|nr:SulP family inorganic anion transporter [Trueperaceae bacterium]
QLQDAPAAILSGAAAAIVAANELAVGNGADISSASTFMTVVALASIAALVTGALFLAFGLFRLGRLVRFLPFPVVGGFMAGTGWLLLVGGMNVMSGVTFSSSYLSDLFARGTLVSWLPGLLFAVVILIVTRLSTHFLVWPLLLGGGGALFYLIMALTGGSIAGWQSLGHLLGPFPDSSLFGAVRPADLALVDWSLVVAHLPTVATVAGFALLAILLNATAIELVADRRIDLNRELRIVGLGNLLSGALGGSVGYHTASLTTLNYKVGTGSKLSGVVAWLSMLSVLLFGASLFNYMPKAIIGGTIAFLGLAFLYEWLVVSLRRLSTLEYSIVVVILLVVAAVGFLPGVAAGLVLTVALFVVSYSRVDAVRHSLNGSDLRSRVKRSGQERALIDEAGPSVLILQLQGFLFFGTANSVLERIDRRTKAGPPIDCVILDFRRVTGIDASAVLVLRTLARSSATGGYLLVLTEIGSTVATQLERRGLRSGAGAAFRVLDSLDDALEFSEERRLARAAPGVADAAGADPLGTALTGSDIDRDSLLTYLNRVTLVPGEALVRQGDSPNSLYIVAKGRLTARLEAPGQPPRRLETMGAASLVGELGFYAYVMRTASVVADVDSEVYCLTRENLARFEAEHPLQAAKLHALVARLMAERMVHLMGVVEALQR